MRVFIALALVICILSISIVQGRRVRERTITASEKIGLGVLTGPEGIAFDPLDSNIAYTGISDGSIRKVNLSTKEVTFYAYTVPSLNATQRAVCGTSPIYESVCGRPLGLVFDKDNNLIVADAYKGIIRIPRSNPANIEVLVNSFDGVPFKMLNSIVILKDGRTAYFTDTTQIYTRAQFVNIVIVNKPDGRLFKFDLVTKQIQVVIDDLRFANGIALSEDEDFLVVNECSAARIRRLCLKGHRAGRNDIFVDNIGGYNDNIKRDSDGNFLVALFGERIDELDAVHESTKLQNIFLQYVPPTATIGMIAPIGLVKKVDPRGRVIEVIADRTATLASYVSEADEHDGFLYLGSVILPYLTRVSLSSGLSH